MSSIKKNILLTFDYEPFLGKRSGSAENCMLEPTSLLIEILDKYKAKAVFFVDVLFILQLKKHFEFQLTIETIKNQLLLLYKKGHYIFPHLHPHWTTAKYIQTTKEFDLSNLTKYSLANLDIDQVNSLFENSFSFLKECGISYPYWGYRAGGWCIQPFSRYKNIFSDKKIKYEFSVMPGYMNSAEEQYFDFSKIKLKLPYHFSNTVSDEEQNGEFTEFPISSICLNKREKLLDKFVKKVLWKLHDRGFGKGMSAQTAALKSNDPSEEMISLELLTVAKTFAYKKFLNNNSYMHWISHPKMFTRHSLNMFNGFLKYAHKHFEIEYDFKNMQPEKFHNKNETHL